VLEAQQKIDKAIPAIREDELHLKNPYAPGAAAPPAGK
jgi:hypothetical protein